MEDIKYKCEKCHYETNIHDSYKKHLNSTLHNTGKRKIRKDKKCIDYTCPKCSYTSTLENNYKTHYLNNHGTIEERKEQFKYYCDKCNFGTFIEQCYSKHLLTTKHKLKQL